MVLDYIEQRYFKATTGWSATHIVTFSNNSVSLLLAFVLNHHKPMGLYWGGPSYIWVMGQLRFGHNCGSTLSLEIGTFTPSVGLIPHRDLVAPTLVSENSFQTSQPVLSRLLVYWTDLELTDTWLQHLLSHFHFLQGTCKRKQKYKIFNTRSLELKSHANG